VPIERRSSTPIRFGPFEVDSVSGELRKQGIRMKLQEQPLQILQLLLEHPGDVVTREELRKCLWPADTFVDFDHGLYNAIKRLRESLGDTAETPRFIETVPRRGYRFIAPVNGAPHTGELSSPSLPTSAATPQISRPPRAWNRIAVAAMGLLLVGAFPIVLNVGGSRDRLAGRPHPSNPSAAVLAESTSTSGPGHPPNPEAAENLLEGRTHVQNAYEATVRESGTMKLSEEEFSKGIALMERAIQEDPGYVPAYLGLGKAIMGEPPHHNLRPKAQAALLRALALDQNNADAHLLMAEYLGFGEGWDEPENHYKTAIQLRPGSAEVHEAYAEYMDAVGRYQEGIKEHQKAEQLDPNTDYLSLSPLMPLMERLERKRKFMATNPPNGYDYWMRGEMEYEAAQYADAVKDWAGIAREYGWTKEADTWEKAFAAGGPAALAGSVARSLDEIAKHRWFPRDFIIDAHLYTGDKEATLAWLQTAAKEDDTRVLRHLRSDYRWDPYRSDPRFQQIIHLAGLAP
jgi:DNA-binding winged helix-turn-helix (wHTH) protein/tetratricopeptide (TPR) repeat protein